MKRPLLCVGLLLLPVVATRAEIATNRVRLAQDVTARVRGDVVTPQEAASVGPADALALADLQLPDRAHVDAFLVQSNLIVFSTDVSFEQGGAPYDDEDLVAYDPITDTFALYFDGSANGVPARADLDAAAIERASGKLLLSFDIPVYLAGAGLVRPNDIARREGGSVYLLVYDGENSLGLPPNANLDALAMDGSNLFYSADITSYAAGSGSHNAAWKYTIAGGTRTRVFEGTELGMAIGANLNGLDDPVDSDNDWLTDFEELTGMDEKSTVFPGTLIPLSPNQYRSLAGVFDSDGDGFSDGEEGAAGTNPTNLLDYLRITGVANGAPGQVVTWASVAGKRYDLQSALELSVFTNTVANNVSATGPYTSRTNAGGGEAFFYRIRLEP